MKLDILLLALVPAVSMALQSPANAQGGALLFDGVDDFCLVPDSNDDFDLGASFTIEAWVRVDTQNPLHGLVGTTTYGLSLK